MSGIGGGPRSRRRTPASSGMRCLHSMPTAVHVLFAHCVGLSVNAVHESWNRRPRALVQADRVAEAVDLDIAAAAWSPTANNYLGRVTKARILKAVREAKGEQVARLIDHLKKGEMAEKAQELLAG